MRERDSECYLCKIGDAHFCRGCGFYVCADCDQTSPEGDHAVEEHTLAEQNDFTELNFNDED